MLGLGLADGVVTLFEHALGPGGPILLLLQVRLGDLNPAFHVLQGLRKVPFQVLLPVDLRQGQVGFCRLFVDVILFLFDVVDFAGLDPVGLRLVDDDLLILELLDQAGIIQLDQEIGVDRPPGLLVGLLYEADCAVRVCRLLKPGSVFGVPGEDR